MTETVERELSCESEYDPTESQNTRYYGYRNPEQNPGTNRDFHR